VSPAVIGFGDSIVDRYRDRRMSYAGDNAYNVAVFAARLGARSAYLGVVGDDDDGRYLGSVLDAERVDASHCAVRPGETAWCEVDLVEGDRTFVRWNDGGVTFSDPFVLSDDDLHYIDGFDLLHTGAFANADADLPTLSERGVLLSYDFSSEAELRTPERLGRVCAYLDIAQFSCSDLTAPDTADLLKQAVDHGAGAALGTRGVEGAVFFDGTQVFHGRPEPVAAPLDTMGCGDAFLAAFLVVLLRGGWRAAGRVPSESVATALHEAARFAAATSMVEGALGHGVAY
jgi:fructoselysine 6-kinase